MLAYDYNFKLIQSGCTGGGFSGVTSVSGGTNINITGSQYQPIVNLDLDIILDSVTATTISGGTFYSGSTPLETIIQNISSSYSGTSGTSGNDGFVIIDITYAALKSLKTANNLVKDTVYFITDRDIWIVARSNNELEIGCKRRFAIVKDIHYTPNAGFLGIYGQTMAQGTVPNSGTYYNVIWGGRVWRRLATGADGAPVNDWTMGSGWVLIPTTGHTDSTNYYENKIFDIKYNFIEDLIWTQSDDRGNVIKREDVSNTFIDITDWGNDDIYNNENFGIYNNFRNTQKAIIYSNSNNGVIYNNSSFGSINSNSNNGVIFNNSNGGSINNNSNIGNIESNSNGGNISTNSNKASIYNNSNNASIFDNSNGGSINDNSNGGSIGNNSNGGSINDNSNNGYINYNSCKGIISNNSNYGRIEYNANNGGIVFNSSLSSSRTLSIYNNINNGYINYNRAYASININNNTNNGFIGGTTNIARFSTIQDTQTNKG